MRLVVLDGHGNDLVGDRGEHLGVEQGRQRGENAELAEQDVRGRWVRGRLEEFAAEMFAPLQRPHHESYALCGWPLRYMWSRLRCCPGLLTTTPARPRTV